MVERLLGLLLIISRNPQYVAKVAFFAVGALIVTLIVTSKVHQGRKIAALKAQANLPITAVVVKAGTGMKTGLEFRVTDSKQIEAFKIALQTVKNPYWNRPGSSIELIIKGPDGSEFTVPGGEGMCNFLSKAPTPWPSNVPWTVSTQVTFDAPLFSPRASSKWDNFAPRAFTLGSETWVLNKL